MHWTEYGFAVIEDDCTTPITVHVDAKGAVTGSVTCKMHSTGTTDLEFTGTLVGKDITGTIDFFDAGGSWSDEWFGNLVGDDLFGTFVGKYYVPHSTQGWSYEGSFTLDP
jgi:hypothetical protein